MTVRDGMIQAIQARVLERNSYDESIDAELIESIASNIATGIEIKNPYKECGNSYVVYIETEKQWKARAFKNIIDAIKFSSGMLCETDIVSCGQRIDWVILKNKIIYRDIHANKNIAVKIEK